MASEIAGIAMELTMVLRSAVPTVPLDVGVKQATSGVWAQDALPLLTMAPCLQTLALHWRHRRYADFALFSCGFILAIIYHWLHMHPEGIANAQLLGLPGSAWRGLDILCAQALLARTLGHAVGAHTTLLCFLSNLLFPAALLSYAHLLADGVLTLGFASKTLVVVLLATLAAKATLEGWHTLPRYCYRRGRRTLWCFAAGFAVFPLPELFPRHYWLFHSLWHLAMAEGYSLLYQQLEGVHLAEPADLLAPADLAEPAGCDSDSDSSECSVPSSLLQALPLRSRLRMRTLATRQ